MSRKIVLTSLAVLTISTAVLALNYLPLLAREIVTVTGMEWLDSEASVTTVYSNRLLVHKESGMRRASRMRLSNGAYAEIIRQVRSLPHEGNTKTLAELKESYGYIFSLRIDGRTYYTSLEEGDEPLDSLVKMVCLQAVPPPDEPPPIVEDVVVKSHTVENSAIHGDLSASWAIPFDALGMEYLDISLIDSEGCEKNYSESLVAVNTISETTMIEYLAVAYPRKLKYVRFDYQSWLDETTIECNYVDIDVSMIEVNQSGEPLNLLTLKKTGGDGKWLTLSGGDTFLEGHCYCVKSYHTEPSFESWYVFKAEHTGQTYEVDSSRWVGGSCDNLFIQEVFVSGDPVSGFEVVFTPEPEKPFEVVQ